MLLVMPADGCTFRFVLRARPIVAGRSHECDLFIDDPAISRVHARFALTPLGHVVEDLGSANGTSVNSRPCSGRPLKHGDCVGLGSTLVVFVEPERRFIEHKHLSAGDAIYGFDFLDTVAETAPFLRADATPVRICPYHDCIHGNPGWAKFCSLCGRPFDRRAPQPARRQPRTMSRPGAKTPACGCTNGLHVDHDRMNARFCARCGLPLDAQWPGAG